MLGDVAHEMRTCQMESLRSWETYHSSERLSKVRLLPRNHFLEEILGIFEMCPSNELTQEMSS